MARATSVFDKQAANYRGPREKLIPQLDRFYGMVPEAVGLAGSPARILDLGAGTGMLSAVVAESFPDARFTLFDYSPRMLEQAGEILGDRAEVKVGDMYEGIPAGPWDAVISALAIHRIEAPELLERDEAVETNLLEEAVGGFAYVRREVVLRVLAIAQCLLNVSHGMTGTVFFLFVVDSLGFETGPLGMIFAFGGVASLGGALIAGRFYDTSNHLRRLAMLLLVCMRPREGIAGWPLCHRYGRKSAENQPYKVHDPWQKGAATRSSGRCRSRPT